MPTRYSCLTLVYVVNYQLPRPTGAIITIHSEQRARTISLKCRVLVPVGTWHPKLSRSVNTTKKRMCIVGVWFFMKSSPASNHMSRIPRKIIPPTYVTTTNVQFYHCRFHIGCIWYCKRHGMKIFPLDLPYMMLVGSYKRHSPARRICWKRTVSTMSSASPTMKVSCQKNIPYQIPPRVSMTFQSRPIGTIQNRIISQ